jgi:hypothetical protein
MRRGLKLRNYEITKLQNSQRGYMMLTLVLALALICSQCSLTLASRFAATAKTS